MYLILMLDIRIEKSSNSSTFIKNQQNTINITAKKSVIGFQFKMEDFCMTAKMPKEVHSTGTSQDYLKIEPFFAAEYADCSSHGESMSFIKIEPASPVRDNVTLDGTKKDIVYEECVQAKNDIVEKEIYQSVKPETPEIGLCSENDTNELVVGNCGENHHTIGHVDDVEFGLQQDTKGEECRTDDFKKTLSPSQQWDEQSSVHGISLDWNNVFRRDKDLWCDVCKKLFPCKSDLTTHMRIHTSGRLFICEVCKKAFTVKFSLSKHMRIHTGEKPFSCNVCEKSFSIKFNLSKHMRTHTGEKPFVCKICEKSFSHKSNLSEHTRTHTGEKPFTCNVCQMSFSHKNVLLNHMRSHTGEKPFTCNVCEKSFSQKSHLSEHMYIHTGEKPFACNVCEKSFSKKSHLPKHMRIHTGEKPFICNVCEKSFSCSSNLSKHFRRIHK